MRTDSEKKDILSWLSQTDIPLSVISKKSKVSRATLYNWKTNATKVGNKGADKIINVYKDEIHITTKDINVEGSIKIKYGNEGEGLEAQYIIGLQKDKIESQANKILFLEKQLTKRPVHLTNGKIPSWSDIEYDVTTKQSYKSGQYNYFETYEMIHYQDFYKRLGYSEEEAEKYWKTHHKFMTTPVEQRGTNLNLIETMGFMMNLDKTDISVTDPKETKKHMEVAIKNNIVNQLQIYNACYIGKNGNEILAIISVLLDFVTHQSESKIKFLNLN